MESVLPVWGWLLVLLFFGTLVGCCWGLAGKGDESRSEIRGGAAQPVDPDADGEDMTATATEEIDMVSATEETDVVSVARKNKQVARAAQKKFAEDNISYRFNTYPRHVFLLRNQLEIDQTEQFNQLMYRINTYARQLLASVPQDLFVKQFVRFNAMGTLHKFKNNYVVIPRYNFHLPKEHDKFGRHIHELFDSMKSARTSHELGWSEERRVAMLHKVMALTRTNVFHSVADYMNKRHEVYRVLVRNYTGIASKIDKDQLRVIDENFKFFETANTNGHCAYLAAGYVQLLSLIQSQKTHNRVLGIYKALLEAYVRWDDQRKHNEVYLVIQSMVRMHLSAYGGKKSIATSEEVLAFMKVTYANLSGVQPFDDLSQIQLLEIIMMLTVLYRVYLLGLFFDDPGYLLGLTLVNCSDTMFINMKGFLQTIYQRFQVTYGAEIAPKGAPIPLSLEAVTNFIQHDERFEAEREYRGAHEVAEELAEEVLYGYSFVQKLFQINLSRTDADAIRVMFRHHDVDTVRTLYEFAYNLLHKTMNLLVTEVMTTDVYGGLYDNFSMGRKTYTKINWDGTRRSFCETTAMVLGDNFDLDTIIPQIVWEPNDTFKTTVPGRMILTYTKWKRATETPEEIARSIRALSGFSPTRPEYAPENIAYVLDVTNKPLNERIAKYPYVLVMFPNHMSLLVADRLTEKTRPKRPKEAGEKKKPTTKVKTNRAGNVEQADQPERSRRERVLRGAW